jgi:hypothetical protein
VIEAEDAQKTGIHDLTSSETSGSDPPMRDIVAQPEREGRADGETRRPEAPVAADHQSTMWELIALDLTDSGVSLSMVRSDSGTLFRGGRSIPNLLRGVSA